MIQKPHALTVKRKINRPTEAQIAAFRNIPTGYVSDALFGGGALSGAIAARCDFSRANPIVGPAMTAENGPAGTLATLAALNFVEPGDVLVASVSGHLLCSAAGDRVLGMLKNAGGAGLVTDGPVRDREGISQIGLPVWSAGTHPGSAFNSGPGRVGLSMDIGGQAVAAGDMVVADADGVVVVPYARIDEVVDRLSHIRQQEETLDALVGEGQRVPQSVLDILESDQTRYID